MYLSKIQIDDSNHQKIKDLTNLESYHGWIESSFPIEFKNKIRTRKLWRIDTLYGKKMLLIVSESQPNKEILERYGVVGSFKTINYDKFLNQISNGMVARFKLVANPIYSKSTGKNSGKRGRKSPCLSAESQLNYLKNRSTKNGFDLIDSEYTVTSATDLKIKWNIRKANLKKVCYEGRLIIRDVNLLRKVLCNGLGSGKAYGCGLMTIVPELI